MFRLALAFLGALLLLVAGFSIYIYCNRTEIKRLVVDEINRNMITPVSVQDIKIEAWKEFPMLAVSFYGVSASGAQSRDPEELFHAQSIALRFDLRDVLRKKYIVRDILVRGGDFNLKHYGQGSYNYKIWKTKDTLAHPVSFHLRKVLLRNTLVRYRDLPARHDFQLLARTVVARGDLYESGQEFRLKGDIGIHSMKAADFVFLSRHDGYMDVRFSNEQIEKKFKVQKGRIKIENSVFDATGYVCYDRTKPYMDFDFRGKDLRAETLLDLLPGESRRYLADYDFKGRLAFVMNIKGNYTRSPLSVAAKFDYGSAQVRHKKSNLTATDVSVRGQFTNGTKRTAQTCRLVLDTLSLRLPAGMISGRFSMADFHCPQVSYHGSLHADMAELQTFFKLLPGYRLSGHADAQIRFDHKFLSINPEHWKAADFSNALTYGHLRIKDGGMAFPDERSLHTDNFYMTFEPRITKTEPFTLCVGETQIEARLFVENLLPYLLLDKQNLYATARLRSRDMDWEKLAAWMAVSDSPQKENKKNTEEHAPKKNPLKDLYADVDLEIDRLYVPDVKIEHLKALLRYSYTDISAENLCFDALQGTFAGSSILKRQDYGWLVHLQGSVQGMDISSCFKSFNNFGQNQLTYRNIGGLFSADFNLSVKYLNTQKAFDARSLQLWTQLDISDGALQNMESLKKISRFTGEDDLQDIRFSTLHNVIEINNGCIIIPEMQVHSTSGELTFSGTHTFDNKVDYLVNIELSELLSRRRAQRLKDKKQEEFGVVVGGRSRVRLPLHISGLWPDVEIKYAFSKARQGAKERLQENRQELREALSEEYSDLRRKRQERVQEKGIERRRENGEFILDMQEVGVLEPSQGRDGVAKDTLAVKKKKKKYKTEDDFRIEFEE